MAVVPGEGLGMPGFLRLSYATGDEVVATGLERIGQALAHLDWAQPPTQSTSAPLRWSFPISSLGGGR